MREIKFQAINDDGKIVIPDYIDRHGIAWWKENSIPTYTRRIRQFTGFSDKKDQEIYEGDILLNKFGRKIVKWADGGFYCDEEKTIMKIYLWLLDFSKIEIIGNIYENPELLK